jgi:glutathione peroxidase
VILGFPSREFGRQEFDDDAKVAEFAKSKNFPGILMKIGKVTGSDAAEVWKYMKAESGAKDPTWNFKGKFLVSKTGLVSTTTPGTLESDIEAMMKE